jgi:cytochrome c-type biogenesis protein CcmH/NrfG
MLSRMDRYLPILAIFLLTLITYAGSLDGGFVSDDIRTIQDNPLLRSLDWDHVREIFTSFDGPNYMPLKVLSLAVDHQIWGPEPFGFHVTNLLIHILCAWLLYRILLRMQVSGFSALFVALVWAVHPLQVESVAWMSERKNVLSMLLLLAGFHTYLGFSENGRPTSYLGVLVLFVLAMLSKMTAMVLPALCLAYEIAYRFRLRRRDWLASLPMFALALVVGWINLSGNRVHGLGYHGGSIFVTGLTSSVVVMAYLKKILLPTDLMVYYDVRLRGSLADPVPLASVLSLAAITFATLWCVRKGFRAGFWVLWFFITLSPMLNLVPFPALMQDRYMYTAMIGPLVLIAQGFEVAARRGIPRYVITALAALAISGLAVLSFQRVEVFDSPQTFWEDWALRTAYLPSESRRRPPEFMARVRALETAIRRDPEAAAPRATLGGLYYEAGATERALQELEAAHALAPDNQRILLNLGRALARGGRYDEGERMISRAIALEPDFILAHIHMGRVQLEKGDLDGARRTMADLERMSPADSPTGLRWAHLRRRLAQLELDANQEP